MSSPHRPFAWLTREFMAGDGLRREVKAPCLVRWRLVRPALVAIFGSMALMAAAQQWAMAMADRRAMAIERAMRVEMEHEARTLCGVPSLCQDYDGIWRRCPWAKEPKVATSWPDPPPR